MIDTVRLSLTLDPSHFEEMTGQKFASNSFASGSSTTRFIMNPIKNSEEYLPRITVYKRSSKHGVIYQFFVEFSAPKILFGNNVEELRDDDFNRLITALQKKVATVCGITFPRAEFITAPVSVIHVSKNIVFRDYTACISILDTLAKADIARTFDIQSTKYRIGNSLQFHTNSVDISLYDKVAELKQINISPKRSIEKNTRKQSELVRQLDTISPLDIFRYEVRLSSKTKIKRLLPDLDTYDFKTLFSSELSKTILHLYWMKINKGIDSLGLDITKPTELFQNYLHEHPNATHSDALRITASLLIINQSGYRTLQQLVTKVSGVHSWYRLKPKLVSPVAHRYKYLQHISNSINDFTPVRFPLLE